MGIGRTVTLSFDASPRLSSREDAIYDHIKTTPQDYYSGIQKVHATARRNISAPRRGSFPFADSHCIIVVPSLIDNLQHIRCQNHDEGNHRRHALLAAAASIKSTMLFPKFF